MAGSGRHPSRLTGERRTLVALLLGSLTLLSVIPGTIASAAAPGAVRIAPQLSESSRAVAQLAAARASLLAPAPAGALVPTVPWNLVGNSSAASPLALEYISMAYDPANRYVVLFGGEDTGGTAYNQTWTFSAGVWTQLTPTLAPPARRGAALTYDTADGYLLLFGGYDSGTSTPYNDTWSFLGGKWTDRTAAAPNATNTPPYRWFPAMAYDPAGPYVLMFGGCDAIGCVGQMNDTWTYHAGAWAEINTTGKSIPLPRNSASMVWDPSLNATLLYGGSVYYNHVHVSGSGSNNSSGSVYYTGYAQANDTWEFRNGSWSQILLPVNPGHRSDAWMTWDPNGSYVVVFGGILDIPSLSSGYASNETWVFTGDRWWNETQNATVSPQARQGLNTQGTWDSADNYGLLYGGIPSTYGLLSDTWSYAWPFALSLSTNRSTMDANEVARLTAVATGGSLQNFTYAFRGATGGCVASSGSSFNCQFLAAGKYTVEGIANDSVPGVSAYANLTFQVAADPVVSAAPSASTIDLGQPMHYLVTVTNGTSPYSYSYSQLPNGCTSQNTPDLACTATRAGSYHSAALVRDATGYSVSVSGLNLTVNAGPHATAAGSPTTGVVPLTVNLTGAVANGTGPYTYVWSFGDATADALSQSAQHTYDFVGVYTAKFTANDSTGDTSFATVIVQVLAPLNASTVVSPTIGVAPLQVTFSGAATGGSPAYQYSWQFGDASPPAVLQDTGHLYQSPGFYDATLTVTDAVGRTSLVTTEIHVIAPLAGGIPSTILTGEPPYTHSFSPGITGGLTPYSYSWSFGDGGTSKAVAPVHTYLTAGTFTVVLQVTDGFGEATRTTEQVQILTHVGVSLTANVTSVLLHQNVTFVATTSAGLGPRTYVWTGLPAGCATENASTLVCAVDAVATYTVVVNVTDSLGYSANQSLVIFGVAPPIQQSPTGGGSGGFSDWYWIAALIVVVVAGVVVGVLYGRRSRPPPQPGTVEAGTEEPTADDSYPPGPEGS